MGQLGFGHGSATAGVGIAAGLSFLLVIAAFVLSIIVYVKLTGAKAGGFSKATWSWRRFFSFDTFMVSGILKYLYILSAFEIIAAGLSVMLGSMAAGGVIGVFGGLLFALLIIAVGELLCRVSFEFMMLTVKLTENSTIIKNVLTGETDGSGIGGSGLGGVNFAGSTAMPGSASAPVQNPASAPVPPSSPASADEAWTCPACGRTNAKGFFCAGCGAPRV